MIYWCEKCNEPVFDEKLHKLTCKGKLKKISEGSVCNPVFVQERKLLSKIVGKDLTDKKMWYFGSSREPELLNLHSQHHPIFKQLGSDK